jgi:hypothetical protein
MSSAFLETTVLTDYLLKKDGSEKAARKTLSKYDSIVVPQFAWKEFKRGPLANFVWTYNKLVETNSFTQSLAALQRLSRSPHRYLTSTAIQAFHSAFEASFAGVSLEDLSIRYGSKATLDRVHADACRLEIKRAILSSWGRRSSLFGGPVQPLTCYPDADIRDISPRLDISPRDCPRDAECCLKQRLAGLQTALSSARSAIANETRQEVRKRIRVLRQIEKHPGTAMGRGECRDFGDAYFPLFCPKDTVIVTTNIRDIEPMATKLGVGVDKPV